MTFIYLDFLYSVTNDNFLLKVQQEMSNLDKLIAFGKTTADVVGEKTKVLHNNFVDAIDNIDIGGDYSEQSQKQSEKNSQKQSTEQNLEEIEMIESREVGQDRKKSSGKKKTERIKEIEDEKMKITEELKMLDEEIDEIKGGGNNNQFYKKRQKIQKDEKAQKNAENLVKELKNKRKQIEDKKRKQYEKSLRMLQKQEEERKKRMEEEAIRLKQERRQAIIQRMEEQQKRKEERKIIDAQSNQLIVKLKKQEKIQKQSSVIPTNLAEYETKKKNLEKKKNFDLAEIEEHNRKYNKIREATKKEKNQRTESIKKYTPVKYPKNMWIERLEQEENKKKAEQQVEQQRKKKQLEKRLKYGELVKNIFIPKKRERSRDNTSPFKQIQNDDGNSDYKPTTPQEVPMLPKLNSEKSKTQDRHMYKDETLPEIKRSKNILRRKDPKQIKEDDEQEKLKKLREFQLRKQTNERLKKLENKSLDKLGNKEKPKYENYLKDLKVKKDDGSQWKKIMKNDKISEEDKYRELMKKAQTMENKAKLKENKNFKRQADEEAVNLYIGSIQAKLALLEKF